MEFKLERYVART